MEIKEKITIYLSKGSATVIETADDVNKPVVKFSQLIQYNVKLRIPVKFPESGS